MRKCEAEMPQYESLIRPFKITNNKGNLYSIKVLSNHLTSLVNVVRPLLSSVSNESVRKWL